MSDTIYFDPHKPTTIKQPQTGETTITLYDYFPYRVDKLDIISGIITSECWYGPSSGEECYDSEDQTDDGTQKEEIGDFETYIMKPLQPKYPSVCGCSKCAIKLCKYYTVLRIMSGLPCLGYTI